MPDFGLVQSKQAGSTSAGASKSVTLDAAPTVGNLLVFFGAERTGTDGDALVTLPTGASAEDVDWRMPLVHNIIGFRHVQAGDGATWTFPMSDAGGESYATHVSVTEFSIPADSTPELVAGSGHNSEPSTTLTSFASPAVDTAPGQSPTLVVSGGQWRRSATLTPTAPFVSVFSLSAGNLATALAWEEHDDTSIACTWTSGDASRASAGIVAFVAPGGPVVEGAATAAMVFSAAAVGQRIKVGAAAAAMAFGATAVGQRVKVATGAASMVFSAAASGHVTKALDGGSIVPVGAGGDLSPSGDGIAGASVTGAGSVALVAGGSSVAEVVGRGYLLNKTLADESLPGRPFGRVVADREGRLGVGPVSVGLGNRGGVGQVVPLRAGLDGYFERVKGQIGEAECVIPIGGAHWARDRRIVEIVKEWRNELVVTWGDSGVQWVGPVVNLLEDDDSFTLACADLGAWAERRPVAAHTFAATDQVTIAEQLWTDCFDGDTQQSWGVTTEASGLLADVVTGAKPEYVADSLEALGLEDWTWYKRRVLLGPLWGTEPRIRLSGSAFMSPPPVSGLGALGANRVIVFNPEADDGAGGTVLVSATASDAGRIATDGLLVRLFEDTTVGSVGQAEAKAAYHLGRLVRPVAIDIEGTSRLHPRAPTTIDELIPGKIVRVDLEGPRRLSELFELVRVRVYFSGVVELELRSLALEDIGDHERRIARLEASQRRA